MIITKWSDSIVGQRFNRWTVLEYLGRDKYSNPHYLCKCDCGTIRNVMGYNLVRLGVNKDHPISCSCGCLMKDTNGGTKRPYGEASFRQKYREVQRHAKERNIEMNITEEYAKSIFIKHCHYCGVEPLMVSKHKNSYGHFVYNGIDRMDNTKGYVEGNCVPCCRTCNISKNSLPLDEWFAWIERVHRHSIHAGSDLN